jgi:hypothetical protein
LLDSFFVCVYHIMWKSFKMGLNSDVFQLRFILEDLQDLIHSLANVKDLEVFDKVLTVFVKDCVIQDIMHEKVNKLASIRHLFTALFKA